jgi:hypothetical protein
VVSEGGRPDNGSSERNAWDRGAPEAKEAKRKGRVIRERRKQEKADK